MSIEYYLDETIGSGGYPMDIRSVYVLSYYEPVRMRTICGANDVFGCNGALLPSDFEIDMTPTAEPVWNVLTKGENSESGV